MLASTISLAVATMDGTTCSSLQSFSLATYSLYALFLMKYHVEIILKLDSAIIHA